MLLTVIMLIKGIGNYVHKTSHYANLIQYKPCIIVYWKLYVHC